MGRVALNIIGYQLAWWSCILSAAAGRSWIGLCVTALVVTFHLGISAERSFEWWLLPLVAVLGYGVDTLAAWLDALAFPTHGVSPLPAPLWVAALWLSFATTLRSTFRFLSRHYWLAAIVGGAAGPLAYAAGAAFGVNSLPHLGWSLGVLFVAWGALLPAVVWLADRAASRAGLARPAAAPVSRELTQCG